LSVLNYMVTSNHVHLLAFDNGGRNVIPDSIKLVAGRAGQEYNVRKNRKGAFWQDRYHATAVESNRHLRQCITYIDMNMVRAGVVEHPGQWKFCGYNEIQNPIFKVLRRKSSWLMRLYQYLDSKCIFDLFIPSHRLHPRWVGWGYFGKIV
jgi:Transposase IS200 like